MKRWLVVSGLSALVALSTLAGVHAQGVTQPFTYQGYLRQGGAPLNNPSQSMRFRIFDALTGGTMLWDSGALTVNVSNGLFTVQLNPPVSVWTGADRFLEIQVGTTTLTPRVRIGATPYANTATLLNMFRSGTTNPDRMVITHSPAFSNWGLQYRDSDDSFHFLNNGATVLRIGLAGPTALQIPADAGAGRVLTSDAAGNASWQDLPAGASVWAVSGANIYNTNTGNVGIGTTTPTAKLDVRGGMLVDSSSGSLRIGYPSSANQWLFNTIGGGANLQLWENAANAVRMFFAAGGNIGIGTTAPAARLDILGGNWDTASTEGDLRIGNATYRLKIGVATGGGGAGHATIAAQGGVNALSLGAGTTLDTQRTLTILGTGNVGIGTASPAATLDVNGNTILRGNISFDDDIRSIIFPPTTAPNAPMIYMFSSGTSNSDRMVIAHSPSFPNWGIQYRDSDDSIHFQGGGFTQVRIGLGDGNVGIGTASPAAKLDVNGTARVKVLEITGADLAEKFPTTETLEPGTVVEIDPDNPGHLRKARGAYNTRVAGVVAGANGLSKGIILGNLEGSENHTPIAISGRVWVYADATQEAIEPGDLLTTSDTPGYAMKASDPSRAHGAVLGKAMTRLEKGKTGMVLVLVNLQ
jgi:hypothetical protein